MDVSSLSSTLSSTGDCLLIVPIIRTTQQIPVPGLPCLVSGFGYFSECSSTTDSNNNNKNAVTFLTASTAIMTTRENESALDNNCTTAKNYCDENCIISTVQLAQHLTAGTTTTTTANSTENGRAFILDCRPALLYENLHIKTSINVNLPPILYKRLVKGTLSAQSIISPGSTNNCNDKRDLFVKFYKETPIILIKESDVVKLFDDKYGTDAAAAIRQTFFNYSGTTIEKSYGKDRSDDFLTRDISDKEQKVKSEVVDSSSVSKLLFEKLREENCDVKFIEGGLSKFFIDFPNLCQIGGQQHQTEQIALNQFHRFVTPASSAASATNVEDDSDTKAMKNFHSCSAPTSTESKLNSFMHDGIIMDSTNSVINNSSADDNPLLLNDECPVSCSALIFNNKKQQQQPPPYHPHRHKKFPSSSSSSLCSASSKKKNSLSLDSSTSIISLPPECSSASFSNISTTSSSITNSTSGSVYPFTNSSCSSLAAAEEDLKSDECPISAAESFARPPYNENFRLDANDTTNNKSNLNNNCSSQFDQQQQQQHCHQEGSSIISTCNNSSSKQQQQQQEKQLQQQYYYHHNHHNSHHQIDSRFPIEIIPHLFLGNSTNSADKDTLLKYNIKYILNVTPDLPNVFENDPDFRYLKLPIYDHWSQDLLVHFPAAISFIDEARDKRCGILVHCLAGISRSVTVTVAYLMRTLCLNLEDAYDLVKNHKPNIAPNLNFMGQLLDFQRDLYGENLPANKKTTTTNLLGHHQGQEGHHHHHHYLFDPEEQKTLDHHSSAIIEDYKRQQQQQRGDSSSYSFTPLSAPPQRKDGGRNSNNNNNNNTNNNNTKQKQQQFAACF